MNTIKKIGLVSAVTFALFAFNACGDDSSSTSAPGENSALSSAVEDDESSSSINDNSSSSVTSYSDQESSSSSKTEGSCSSGKDPDVSNSSSSSEEKKESSSSVKKEESSSSVAKSSSSLGTSSSSTTRHLGGECTQENAKAILDGEYCQCINGIWVLYVPPSSSSVAYSSSVVSSSSAKSGSSSIKDGSEYDASANTLTDLRDGQVYKTVTIGTQTWMAENLNYAYKDVKFDYYDFDDHNEYTSDSTSWCYYDEVSNCEKYGRLYTWSAVMDSAAQFSINAGTKCGYNRNCTPNSPHRGICPEGWHVPDDTEWNTLWTAVGGTGAAGSKLKSTSGWYSGNSTNSYGFTVLPVGYRDYNGYFRYEGYYAHFWSSSVYDSFHAHYWYFSHFHGRVDHGNYPKNHAFSVRCIKD